MTDEKLGPIDPAVEPLLLAIGRAVLAAAALEKVLLVDIAYRRAMRDGFVPQLADDLTRLERLPAGALLQSLKDLGIDDELARRISEVIDRRNKLVHGFMDDRDVIVAFESGNAGSLVEPVERFALDCQRLVNEVGHPAFGGIERIFGLSFEQLLDAVLSIDPTAVADTRLREQLDLIRAADLEALRASLAAEARPGRSDQLDT